MNKKIIAIAFFALLVTAGCVDEEGTFTGDTSLAAILNEKISYDLNGVVSITDDEGNRITVEEMLLIYNWYKTQISVSEWVIDYNTLINLPLLESDTNFSTFPDFNNWYASTFSPTFKGDSNFENIEADNYYGGTFYGTVSGMQPDTTLDTNTTADLNWLGTPHSFTTDQNFVNIGMTGGFSGFNAIGDSNFVNVGFSNAFGGSYYGTWLGNTISPAYYTDTNFMTFADFNNWYASRFSPNFIGDSNFSKIGVSGNSYLGGTLDMGTNQINNLTHLNFVDLIGIPTLTSEDASGLRITADFFSIGKSNEDWGVFFGSDFFSGDGGTADNAYDLGQTTSRFRNLYLAGSLSDATNSLTVANAKSAYDLLSGGVVSGDFNVVGDLNVSGKVAFNNLRNWNANSVLMQDLNVLGDANIANLSISGVTFSNNGINVTGDSNFTSLGFSNAFGGSYYGTWLGNIISPVYYSDTNFSTFADFNNWYASRFSPNFVGDSNFTNLEANDAYITNLTVTGDFNAGSIKISGVSFADGGINATGDSNFTNIGISGDLWGSSTTVITADKFRSNDSTASGENASAIGTLTIASGTDSFATGYNTTASGNYSTATGYKTTATGLGSFAIGNNVSGTIEASGHGSFAGGYNEFGTITASNLGSFAGGYNAFGTTTASGKGSFAGGYINFGTATASNSGSMAFGYATSGKLLSGGKGSISMGNNTKAFGDGAVALGYDTNANGKGAIALGNNCDAVTADAICLGKDLTNYNANSVLVQDLNVAGTPYFDGNFSIKRETDAQIFICGIDALGALTCN